jgi:arylsulfatase A-like enzyme
MPRLITALLLILFAAPVAHAASPNILFVLIDDMGNQDLSCFGSTRVKTPAIDKLAAEGIRFTRFYDAAPICSPSRCAFLTGQYPGRWRITSFLSTHEEDKKRGIADWLDPKAPTVARMLSDAGYYTAHVGKWHLGGQREIANAPLITEYGFAASLTSMEGLGERIIPEFEPVDGKPFKHPPSQMNAKVGVGPIHFVPRQEVTMRYVDRAMTEMKNAKSAGKPFFINLWLDDVHSPVQPPNEFRGNNTPVDRYLGVIKEMDRQLGRVFDTIRADEALRDNTIVVLTSDNGPEPGLGSAGELRGSKGQLYEGGIRNPLIVWWPGGMAKPAIGTTNDTTVVAGIDFCPSFIAMAGAKVPADAKLDGLDLSEALAGRAQPKRPAPMMWVRPPDRPGPKGGLPDLAIRDGDWKLLVKRDGSNAELFDIVGDPNEKKNLAKQHAGKVKELTERVVRWDVETNQSAPPGPMSKP